MTVIKDRGFISLWLGHGSKYIFLKWLKYDENNVTNFLTI